MMSTKAMQQTPLNSRTLLIFGITILLVVAISMAVVLQIRFTQHAMTSHAAFVDQANNCFDGPGKLTPWYKATLGRFIQFCNDGGRYNYGRVVECDGDVMVVVTQFPQAVKKLLRYLKNQTFGSIEGEPPCQ